MAYYFSYDAKLESFKKVSLMPDEYELIYLPEERHCTMLYSDGKYHEVYMNINLPSLDIQIKDIVMWERKTYNYLVALLDNEVLATYHEKLKKAVKDVLIQDKFEAHVTLQKTPTGKLTLSPEKFKDLKNTRVHLDNFRCINQANKSQLKIKY